MSDQTPQIFTSPEFADFLDALLDDEGGVPGVRDVVQFHGQA